METWVDKPFLWQWAGGGTGADATELKHISCLAQSVRKRLRAEFPLEAGTCISNLLSWHMFCAGGSSGVDMSGETRNSQMPAAVWAKPVCTCLLSVRFYHFNRSRCLSSSIFNLLGNCLQRPSTSRSLLTSSQQRLRRLPYSGRVSSQH